MYSYNIIDKILILNDNEKYFFDPENLLIFCGSKKNDEKDVIKNYKKDSFQLANRKDIFFSSHSLNLEIHLTENCNLRCRYCYIEGNDVVKKRSISKDTIEKIFNFAKNNFPEANFINISLFGGEPLLFQKNLKFILEKAKEVFFNKKFSITLPTNGTIFNKTIEDFLKEKQVGFSISIDGDQKAHDFLRPDYKGQGSFAKLEKNLFKFKKINNFLFGRVTITPHNYNLSDIYLSLKEKGFNKINFVVCSSQDKNFGMDLDKIELLKREWEKLADIYLEHIINDENIVEIISFSNYLKGLFLGIKKKRYCSYAKNTISVSIDEKLYPCHRFVGNPLFEIGDLNSGINKVSPIITNVKNFNVKNESDCSECFAKHLCAGGCEHEQSQLPKKFICEINKHLLSLSILIYAKLASKYPEGFKKLKKIFVKS
jgi:uncharacterized protein